MANLMTAFKASYVAGETATVSVQATEAAAVVVIVGAGSTNLANVDGVWSAKVPTAKLVGRVRWSVMVTGTDGTVSCLARGVFTVVCAGRSPLRDVVDKIDEAVRTWGTNPNRSISVGEIRIDYKSLDDLLAVRAQYVQMAEEQENGRSLTGGLRVMEVRFDV